MDGWLALSAKRGYARRVWHAPKPSRRATGSPAQGTNLCRTGIYHQRTHMLRGTIQHEVLSSPKRLSRVHDSTVEFPRVGIQRTPSILTIPTLSLRCRSPNRERPRYKTLYKIPLTCRERGHGAMLSIFKLSHFAKIPNWPSTFPRETFKMKKSLCAVWPGATIKTRERKGVGSTAMNKYCAKICNDVAPKILRVRYVGTARLLGMKHDSREVQPSDLQRKTYY